MTAGLDCRLCCTPTLWRQHRWGNMLPKFQLARRVTSWYDTFDVSSPCIFGVSSLSNSTARSARPCRDVTSQVEFGLIQQLWHFINEPYFYCLKCRVIIYIPTVSGGSRIGQKFVEKKAIFTAQFTCFWTKCSESKEESDKSEIPREMHVERQLRNRMTATHRVMEWWRKVSWVRRITCRAVK